MEIRISTKNNIYRIRSIKIRVVKPINKVKSIFPNKQFQIHADFYVIFFIIKARTYFNDTFFIFKNINNQPIVLD